MTSPRPTRSDGRRRRRDRPRRARTLAHNYHPLARRRRRAARAPGSPTSTAGATSTASPRTRPSTSATGIPCSLPPRSDQLDRITLTSRAFHNDQLGPFADALATLAGEDMVLPMNTGAEAVESAHQGRARLGLPGQGRARRRGQDHRHGRQLPRPHDDDHQLLERRAARATTSARSRPASSRCPTATRLRSRPRSTRRTVAVLVEPIQGEAGIVVPPADYLPAVREITHETQRAASSPTRSSRASAAPVRRSSATTSGVVPDLYLLGKALGGGIVPVSAVVGDADVLGVLRPGEHGSTFGGNPLAAAVGLAVVELLATGEMQERARELGRAPAAPARRARRPRRGRRARRRACGRASTSTPRSRTGREVCEALLERGVLAKDTHGSTIRFAPPIVVERDDLDWAVDQLEAVLRECARRRRAPRERVAHPGTSARRFGSAAPAAGQCASFGALRRFVLPHCAQSDALSWGVKPDRPSDVGGVPKRLGGGERKLTRSVSDRPRTQRSRIR